MHSSLVYTDVRLENVEVRLSNLDYRIRCIESNPVYNTAATYSEYSPSEYNTASAWPAMIPTLPPHSFNQMTPHSPASYLYNQMTPQSTASYLYNQMIPHSTASYSYNQMTPHSTVSYSYNQTTPYPMASYSYNQVAPHPMAVSYNHMSTPPIATITQSSMNAAMSMGVAGGPPFTCTDSTSSIGFTGPSKNVTTPPPSGPFLAMGKPNTNYLPSSAIQTDKLRPIDEVILQNQNYINELNAGTLCQALAREAIFGKDVLARCTITGNGGKTALPLREMNNLKTIIFNLFPKYSNSPAQFESLWKKCTISIEQACGRHRREWEKKGK